MKKRRIGLIALLVLAFTLCAGAVIACGGDNGGTNKTKQYTLTWDVNSNVTVAVNGYTEIPTKVDEGTELSFTATPATGWIVTTVTPANVITRQQDGSYKMTVTKDLSIKVNAREQIESLNVTQNKTLYAGDTIKEGDITVSAHYATNRDEEIPFGNYSIDYGKVSGGEDATALTLGQTSVKITYDDGVEKDLTFATPIKALIKIDLFGGTITAAELDAFKAYDGYAYDEEKSVISWQIAQATADAIELPVPTKVVNGNEFPFKGWQGAAHTEAGDGVEESWQIAAGLDTSKTFTAAYDAQLIQIDSLAFSTETATENEKTVYIPYLTISGEFVAAETAYLYLYEGNDKVELKGDEVTKSADSNEFVLKYDLRKLAVATVEDEDSENYGKNFLGKWMDIKFQAAMGGRTETQEIDLNNYADDFVNSDDSVRGLATDDSWYSFSYKVYTPSNSEQRLLKLVCSSAKPWDLSAELITKDREVPGEGEGAEPTLVPTAYLKITGVVDEHATFTVEELKAAVEATTFEMLANGSWSPAGGTVVVTVTEPTKFTVEYNLDNTESRKNYFMHYPDGGTNLASSACAITPGTVTVGTINYTLSDNSTATDWTKGLLWLEVLDPTTVYVGTSEYDVVEKEGKLYLVINGEFAGDKTAEQIKAMIGQVDFELDGDSTNKTVVDAEKVVVEVNSEDKTFTITAEIPTLARGKYWTHVTTLIGDVKPKASAAALGSDGNMYRYLSENRGTWTAYLLEVALENPVKESAVRLETEGEGDAAKLYYIVEYAMLEGKTKAQVQAYFDIINVVNIDLQDRGGNWVKHTFTDKTITVNDDGSVTVKIDISSLAEQSMANFTTHLELNDAAKASPADFKPAVESFQNAPVAYKGKNYVIRFVKGAGAEADFWGCVGIDVSAIAA